MSAGVDQPAEQRVPCPRCGESVKDIALQCYVCRADLHVDLVVPRALSDQRAVYGAAKQLCAQFPNLQFSVVREVLQGHEHVLVRNTTRAVGTWIGGVLQGYGVEYQLAWRDAQQQPRRSSRTGLIVAAGVLLAIGGGVAGLHYGLGWDYARMLALGAKPNANATQRAAAAVVPPPLKEIGARELAARVVPATATVLCGAVQGSGFFVTKTQLVTNQHVLCRDSATELVVVLENGRRLPARVLRAEERLDAAVLEVLDAKITPLPLGDSTSVERGDRVYAVGAPLGMSFTMSQGIVGHPTRRSVGLSYIQIDVSITHGNSGGPLLDEQGQVIGLITYKVGSDATMGLALAIDHLYTGDQPLITAPSHFDAVKWENELQSAWKAGKEEQAEVVANMRRPMLIRAHFDGRKYHAAFGYMGDAPPPRSLVLELSLEVGTRCKDVHVDVGDWRVVDHVQQDTSELPPSIRTWAEHNKLEANIRVGFGSFPTDACPRPDNFGGAELVLKGGMPGFDRVAMSY